MGILISVLRGNNSGPDTVPDLNLNLQNPAPTPEEKEVYDKVVAALRPSAILLQSLRDYRGCGEEIRKAISTPNPDNEQAAWNALMPAVGKLREYYEYSSVLEKEVQLLLGVLAKGDVSANLERCQATTKLLADVLHFVFAFDDLKMTNPNVQNDFSYYRRTLNRSKMRKPGLGEGEGGVIGDELANRMSLFYAYPTPMFRCIAEATAIYVKQNSNVEQVAECLSGITAVCYNAIVKQRITSQADITFCLKAMVASVVLYDHVHPQGVFAKNSPVNVRAIVKCVRDHAGDQAESLLNAIRFSTKHFTDAPKSIKTALQ